jgi:hypothetical protein
VTGSDTRDGSRSQSVTKKPPAWGVWHVTAKNMGSTLVLSHQGERAMPDQTQIPPPPKGAMQIAPIYSNYFTIIATPNIVKISFGEAFGTPESAAFHTAVALSPADAKTLADTLGNFLAAQAKGA